MRKETTTKKKQIAKYAVLASVLAITLIIGAYFIASSMSTASIPAPTPKSTPSPTAAPTPTPTPTATPTATPNQNDLAGISLHSLSMNEARLVNESGAHWIRIDASDDFEVAVTNAKAYNLSVLGILDSWMFNKSSTFTLEEWRSNVTYYVSKYADHVDAWEIWNEPANPTYPLLNLNVSSPENMTKVTQFYFSMTQTASQIIRQHDSTAEIVLFGGLNLYSGGDPHLTLDKEFARQLAAMNIEQYGDAISVHAYPWATKVQPVIWQKYNESLAYYRQLFPTLEVWLTETGHPANFDGETGQAQYLTDSLQFFQQTKVTHLFWYSLLDNPWEENSFGLISHDGTPRLTYQELQEFTGKTN